MEGNPLSSPIKRDINIYLPPDYFENTSRTYPVIYYLHGYPRDNHDWTIASKTSLERSIPIQVIPKEILKQVDVEKLLDFEKLDELILSGSIKPFIFIQPDASLHVPTINKRKNMWGNLINKGSLYINSQYTGNYEDYIIKDVISYVDTNFRTIPNRSHPAIMGGSMGGYGIFRVISHHPELFSVAVALSPGGDINKKILLRYGEFSKSIKVSPLAEKLIGIEKAMEMAIMSIKDHLDTFDLIFFKEKPLVLSLQHDKNGNLISNNKSVFEIWKKNGLITLAQQFTDNLKKLKFLIYCDKNDELRLNEGIQKLHDELVKLDVRHKFELYYEPKAKLSPHTLGVHYHILPGIRFCLENFEQ